MASTAVQDDSSHPSGMSVRSAAALAFVAKHTDLSHVLQDAVEELRRRFGGEECVLDLFRDPEGTASSDKLVLAVRTGRELAEAEALLDDLVQTWWLDRLAAFGDRLTITIEYA